MSEVTRQQAIDLVLKYNEEEFHIRHALTVGGVMKHYAEELGYGDEKEFWEVVGLLHDVDFGMFPDEHCKKAPELLAEVNASDEMVRAIVSHGYGQCSDVMPEKEMEKVLYAADELTGLIWAYTLMRPSKSTKDLGVKSVRKKFKDAGFAAGCDREVIKSGAEMLGWEMDKLFEMTIEAMRSCEDDVNNYFEK